MKKDDWVSLSYIDISDIRIQYRNTLSIRSILGRNCRMYYFRNRSGTQVTRTANPSASRRCSKAAANSDAVS